MVNTTVAVLPGSTFVFHNCTVTLQPKFPLKCSWINSSLLGSCLTRPAEPHPKETWMLGEANVNDSYSTSDSHPLLVSTWFILLGLTIVWLSVTLGTAYQHLQPRLWPFVKPPPLILSPSPSPLPSPLYSPLPVVVEQEQEEKKEDKNHTLVHPPQPHHYHHDGGSSGLVSRRSRHSAGVGTSAVSAPSAQAASREF